MEQRSEAPYPVHSGEAFKTTGLQSPRISFMGGFLTYRTHRLTELYMASQRNGTIVRRVSDFLLYDDALVARSSPPDSV
jgi:hypothetical protein